MKRSSLPITQFPIVLMAALMAFGCQRNDGHSLSPDAAAALPGTTASAPQVLSAPSAPAAAKDVNENLSPYWFIRNGCSTEKQVFKSQPELCAGLQNRELNKNCAVELRTEEFKKRNCPGTFSESEAKKDAIVDNPPIRCVGFVSGDSGRKNIDQSIEWNRKTFQKVVLSSYTDLEHAGEYSVALIPHEDPTRVGAIGLMGAFIDSNKVHKFEGPADSTITLRHKDHRLNNRLVDITCGVEQAKPPEASVEVKMLCSGEISSPDVNSYLTGNFTWNGKDPIRTTMKLTEAQTDSPVSIVLKTDDQGRPVLSAEAALDGHVEMFAEVHGGFEMHSKYLAAWDRRKVDIQCLTAKAMNEAMKRVIEKADKAVAADQTGAANPSARNNPDAP